MTFNKIVGAWLGVLAVGTVAVTMSPPMANTPARPPSCNTPKCISLFDKDPQAWLRGYRDIQEREDAVEVWLPSYKRTTERTANQPPRIAAVATQSTDCRVSLAQYQNLQIGMSYSQVAATLGCNGTETVRSEVAGYTGAIYSWQGSGSLGANMSAQFQNGALVIKSQFGLR